VGAVQAGGGAVVAAKRWRRGALHQRQRAAGAQRGPEEEEGREGSEGPMCKTKRF
jgi:hypothetical protein